MQQVISNVNSNFKMLNVLRNFPNFPNFPSESFEPVEKYRKRLKIDIDCVTAKSKSTGIVHTISI